MTARGWIAVRTVLTVIVAAGLAIDAYVHLDLASTYDVVKTSTAEPGRPVPSGGGPRDRRRSRPLGPAAPLYRAGSRFWSLPVEWRRCSCTAGSTSARLGPLPNMYEPYWYGEKTLSLVAEAIAAVAAAVLLVLMYMRARAVAKPAVANAPSAV